LNDAGLKIESLLTHVQDLEDLIQDRDRESDITRNTMCVLDETAQDAKQELAAARQAEEKLREKLKKMSMENDSLIKEKDARWHVQQKVIAQFEIENEHLRLLPIGIDFTSSNSVSGKEEMFRGCVSEKEAQIRDISALLHADMSHVMPRGARERAPRDVRSLQMEVSSHISSPAEPHASSVGILASSAAQTETVAALLDERELLVSLSTSMPPVEFRKVAMDTMKRLEQLERELACNEPSQ